MSLLLHMFFFGDWVVELKGLFFHVPSPIPVATARVVSQTQRHIAVSFFHSPPRQRGGVKCLYRMLYGMCLQFSWIGDFRPSFSRPYVSNCAYITISAIKAVPNQEKKRDDSRHLSMT